MDWEVPAAIRALGKVPDVRLLEPGDVVLFSPLRPNVMQRAIQQTQRKDLADTHARWTHVSVVFDRERVVEAVTPRVRCGTLYEQATTGALRVRRAVGLSAYDRIRVAVEALSNVGSGYTMSHAAGLGWRAWLPWLAARAFRPHERAVICSQLFSDSFTLVTGRPAVPGKLSGIVPGDLSLSPALQDVPVGWVPLA